VIAAAARTAIRFRRMSKARRGAWHVFTDTRPAAHLGAVEHVSENGRYGWYGHHFATGYEGPLRGTRGEAALDLVRNAGGAS
jgi:hypothetical protein